MAVLLAVCTALTGLVLVLAPRTLAPRAWALRHPAAAIRLWVAALTVLLLAVLGAVLSAAGLIIITAAGHLHPAHLLIPIAVSGLACLFASVWFRFKHRHRASVRSVHAAVAALEPHVVSRSQRAAFVLARVESDEVFSYAVARTAPEAQVGCRPMVIVSTGMQRLLSPAQLQTILAHEYAHVSGGHETLLRIAAIVEASLPARLRFGTALRRSLILLVELAADDAAAAKAGAVHLANALTAVAGETGDPSMEMRAERLTLKEWPLTHRLRVPADFRVA